jgi:ribA/ribD-fused uncharacterized protein
MKYRKIIDCFKYQYNFLSNFYQVNIEWQFKIWPSVEHIFQASKTNKKVQQEIIRKVPTCRMAKQYGKAIILRDDWEKIKDTMMYLAVYQKFFQHEYLQRKLIDTGIAKLVEGNSWHDNYWGDCKCSRCANIKGQNKLGKTLMTVRARIKALQKDFDYRRLNG